MVLYSNGRKGITRYDILSLYQMSGFAHPKNWQSINTLVSEKEHQARYGTTQKEIRQIQAKIRKSDKVKMLSDKKGLRLTSFSIYVTYR